MDKESEEYAKESTSDLATLWQSALTDYYVSAKMDVAQMKVYTSMSDIQLDTDIQKNFEKFRHNGGKVDKLRSLVARNTELIISGATYITEAASAAFPPSSAILTAFTYVMKASQDVSKDYDKITDFFEELNSFLERVNIIESRVPSFEGYRSHLIRVFAAILKTCGLATKATKEGRLKRFGKTILRGGADEDLAGATTTLETALKRLESATGFATLANTEDIKKETLEVKQNLLEVIGATADVASGVQQFNESVQLSKKETVKLYMQMSARFDQMIESQRKSSRKLTFSEIAPKLDSIHRKQTAYNVVKRVFALIDDPQLRYRDFAYSAVEGMTEWFIKTPELVSWMEGVPESPFLWVTGAPGMGKSWISYSVICALQKLTAGNIKSSVAFHYYQGDSLERGALQGLVKSAITQIAQQDRIYCEQVAAELYRVYETIDWSDPVGVWRKYIASKYKQTSDIHLFIVLDAVDEASSRTEKLFEALKLIVSENLNIRVMMTGRQELKPKIEQLHPQYQMITVGKENISDDMHLFIDSWIRRSSSLRKLRPPVKRLIAKRLFQKSESMRYADNMLHRLARMPGERSVAQCLSEMPDGLNGIYSHLQEEIETRRTPNQFQTMKTMFAWLSYAHRRLIMEEVEDVAKLCGHDPFFSAEEEIQGRSGRVLQIIGDTDHVEIFQDEVIEYQATDEDDEALLRLGSSSRDDKSTVCFYNRSMREYFRAPEGEGKGIRIPPSAGNLLIFEMCANIILQRHGHDLSAGMLSYAAANWARHFRAIDPSLISDEEIVRAMSTLQILLTNSINTVYFFETHYSYVENTLPYTAMLGGTGNRTSLFHTALAQWTERAANLKLKLLDKDGAETHEWILWIKANPSKILLQLAKGHVNNWLKLPQQEQVSYDFAVSALNMVGFVN